MLQAERLSRELKGAQDLVVSDFSITVAGTSVTYEATVCNNGSSTSTSFDLEVFYDMSTAPGSARS